MKKTIPVPMSVKISQVLFLIAFIGYLILILTSAANGTMHIMAIATFVLGAAAAALGLTYYKSGSWVFAIFNLVIGIGSYISYMFIAAK